MIGVRSRLGDRMLRTTIFIICGFTALALLGGLLLALPAASVGEPLWLLDAFFTSTSAVCVTGLIVVDTATVFTPFGQIVILALIQLGGLGIISFSAIVLLMLGRRISLVQHDALRRHRIGIEMRLDTKSIAKRIVALVAFAEFAGTAALWFAFLRYFPWEIALYHAAFQSVSAFCNAGFSTFSTSLTTFAGDAFVLLPMMILIVLGGIGFVVVIDLEERLRSGGPLTLQTRLVLWTTLVLLAVGAVLFFLLESGNAMAGRPPGERLLSSLFHSVTCRTAGFNTVEYLDLSNATLVLTMVLMTIGGSPASAAGGVKTTTAAIIFLAAWARLRGERDPVFGNRTVAGRSVIEAVTLTLLAVMVIMTLALVLQMTELGSASHPERRGAFLELSFEAVSAFGTVGLSTGATPGLSPAGKLLIIFTMLVGRLGPLTFFSLLGGFLRAPKYRLYTESVMVG